MRSRSVDNPPNRFRDQVTTYDDGEGPPPASITLLDDHSRTILSHNDSPDLGFRWSVNPYRGCQHACAYCLDGRTPILLGDGRTKPIAELKVGDEIYGTTFDGKYRRYIRTQVLDHWATRKLAYRISLRDGTELIASGDHRFLSKRGWKHVMPAEKPEQRPHLTLNNSLMGTGKFAPAPEETIGYQRGYLCGMVRGDGTVKRYDYSGRRRGKDVLHQFRLALIDLEALARTRCYLAGLAVETVEFEFQRAAVGYQTVRAIRATSRQSFERITDVIRFPVDPPDDWMRGFLAGVFDAEGCHSAHALRISNSDHELLDWIGCGLSRFGFDHVREPARPGVNKPVYTVRIRGGLSEHLRFFHFTGCAISRKWSLQGAAVKSGTELDVLSIEPLDVRPLFDITTGTGDFIANGVISHNCYARPTHEFLDLGAGTDFDTKIVVKRDAAALLRASFDKPSWQGELVMFSGVTDCYQPVERDLALTRQCLEVCAEYGNPVAIITKSALIERDLDVLKQLAERASISVAVSLCFSDNELARAIEPWAPSPDRRFKLIETLATAGIPVAVMAAPMIPGLNDNQLVTILERAAAAGATRAGWVLLRLPGAVEQVFSERVRAAVPLAADKILHRIRETRGGEKLYDPRFHTRGRGEGIYAEMIAQLFDKTCARLGLGARVPLVERDTFQRPVKPSAQLSLF